MKTLEEAFKLYLPKWPQCIIYGDDITPEQALEIIRRTDSFFADPWGNNKDFVDKAKKILQIPDESDYTWQGCDEYNWDLYDKAYAEWKAKWQLVETEYINNEWISCSWIGGPRGWCHPNGKISYCHNIGKYPTVEEVYNELKAIAEAFPFVNLTCVLSDRSEGDVEEWEGREPNAQPVVTFQVKDGKVELIDNVPIDEALNRCCASALDFKSSFAKIFYGDRSRENYFSLEQLQKWADEVFKK